MAIELSETVSAEGKTVTGRGYKLILGDCLQVLPKWPAESVDMIFADPHNFS